jgi:hypothetical protein
MKAAARYPIQIFPLKDRDGVAKRLRTKAGIKVRRPATQSKGSPALS